MAGSRRCPVAAVADRRARPAAPAGDRVPRGAAGLGAARRDRRGDARQPRRDRLRRDRLGQDDAAAEDRARARPRPSPRRRPDRPHPAAPDRRVERRQADRRRAEDAARRGRRLQGPLPGPAVGGREREAHDRRHPARRDAERPAAARLRHDHRRRGARAQPQHRLPARPPAPDPAAPARPARRRHVGDDRRRPLRAALRRPRRPGAGDPGLGPALSGRDPLAPVRREPRPRPRRRDLRRRRRALARPGAAGSGDVLVFLPGEREIRDAAERLRKHHPPGVEVLPLFARLSQQQQDEVFAPHSARRIVLATNVAETSLTVPGIRFVIDAGTARIKRYSFRSKVEQLPIEPISQAAANQRAGRCGRVADGICIRLYDEADFPSRPKFTDPEIVRSSLAGVILRMQSLNLGSVEDFPFLEAPPKRAIADGYQLLNELGATDGAERADDDRPRARAPAARSAHRPHDPRGAPPRGAARGAGRRERAQRPGRSRPAARAAAGGRPGAREVRRREVRVPRHAQALELARAVARRPRRASALDRASTSSCCATTSSRRAACASGATSTRSCSRSSPSTAGASTRSEPTYEQLHQSMLAGLLGNIGVKSDEDESYLGARGIRFWRHPGARLAKKPGRWIVAAELVETTRLYARGIAAIDPRWLPQLAGHLIKTQLLEPHWEKKAAQVVALERATLYGIVVYANRRVDFGDGRPGRGARDLHPRGAGRRRVGDEAAVRRRQPQADRAGRGARAQVAPPGRARRRRADLRVLRPAAARRRLQRRDVRALVPRRGQAPAQAAHADARGADAPRGRRHHDRGVPEDDPPRRRRLRGELPARARQPARRRHGDACRSSRSTRRARSVASGWSRACSRKRSSRSPRPCRSGRARAWCRCPSTPTRSSPRPSFGDGQPARRARRARRASEPACRCGAQTSSTSSWRRTC